MILYHFLNADFGLLAIKNRRIKISRLLGLNDPFEFRGPAMPDATFRGAVSSTIEELNKNRGLLCFSSRWTNPVMWSHYADHHRGICLVFDIPSDLVLKVKYERKRFLGNPIITGGTEDEKIEFMKKLLCIKFSHWRYESEYRNFVALEEAEDDLFFADFSENMKLKCVIAGAQSKLSRSQIVAALGPNYADTDCFKARLAFRSFNVVRNRNSKLWQ